MKELISYKHNKEIRANVIETINFMLVDCTTNEQKAFIVTDTFESVCSELANIIKQKDASAMGNIIEVMSSMMPYMSQSMVSRMPNMMAAALTLVKNLTAEVEKEYGEKEMDEALQE
jgi:hypothetical protein